jgi:hypothetical protein
MLVTVSWAIQHYIPEDSTLHSQMSHVKRLTAMVFLLTHSDISVPGLTTVNKCCWPVDIIITYIEHDCNQIHSD